MNRFVGVVRTVGAAQLIFLDLFYSDGKACGVPQYVGGYEEAAQLLRLAGVSTKELSEKRKEFAKGREVRIALSADDEMVKAMGFDPRWWVPARRIAR